VWTGDPEAVLYRAQRRVLKIRIKLYQAPGRRADDGPVAQAPVPRTSAITARRRRVLKQAGDPTPIVGSHVEA
jgi:hypothetical protein